MVEPNLINQLRMRVTTVTTADAAVEVEEDEKPKPKALGCEPIFGHSVGTGSFLANSYLRETRECGPNLGLERAFQLQGDGRLPLSASARFIVPLVEPQGIDDRRVRFGNTSFG